MSRTHSTRHQWKDKERERTGEGDPDKIRLHRERFLKSKEGVMVGNIYHPLVSQLRLVYSPTEYTTTLKVLSEEGWEDIEVIPYILADLAELESLLMRLAPGIDLLQEGSRLLEHINHIKAIKQPCQMESSAPELNILQCNSAINCKFRRFDDDLQLPVCCR